MKPLKRKVSITLDEDIIEKLKVVAEDCDRSLSQYINLVMREHLKELEEESDDSKKNGAFRNVRYRP
ncbi:MULTISPECIES: DUF6364 family protein [unclassified Ruminococcus]|uniref:DUF6364 family protein n=1 Tax=unclassified Ruminococcus TaxID=2608920 RepID=UPI00210AEB12|nr:MULTISPECIES: DUF6364 family protein [unclassified Ruminococcus]MCQ4023008.1 toxin-antitoxin system protein [Ruminococcus sp. zg-924]MCQ4115445.1 toxin-antitoxin system protein [Ruminococcus sp. zg-921]